MANELTLNASFEYEDALGVQASLEIANLLVTLTTAKVIKTVQTISTSDTAIKLGDISTIKWAMFVNRDSTNYIEVKVASAGAIFAKLLPGHFCIVPLGSGAQAPYAIANTASCLLETIISAL